VKQDDEGRSGRDATLKEPFAKDDEETRNPARTNAWYSLVVKTPGAMAEDVPMRFSTVRNFSTHN